MRNVVDYQDAKKKANTGHFSKKSLCISWPIIKNSQNFTKNSNDDSLESDAFNDAINCERVMPLSGNLQF